MGKLIQRLRNEYRDAKVEVSALFEEIMSGESPGSTSSECDSVEASEGMCALKTVIKNITFRCVNDCG